MADTNSQRREEFRVQPLSCELRTSEDGKPVSGREARCLQ